MKGKILYKLMLSVCILAFCLCGCDKNVSGEEKIIEQTENKDVKVETDVVNEKIGENLPVSRGLAAKMISVAFNDLAEIEAMDKEINFKDVNEADWFYKYVNSAVIQGYMSGTGEEFLALEPLSLYESQILLNKVNSSNKIKIKIDDETRNKPISYSLWCELFEKSLLEIAGDKSIESEFGISEKELVVFATTANSSLAPWSMATDKGIYTFNGYAMDAYIDKKIKVLVKGSDVVCVLSVVEKSPVIDGAYIIGNKDGKASVFVGGSKRDFSYSGNMGDTFPVIANIKIEDGNILNGNVINEKINGVVKKSSLDSIEIEGFGEVKASSGIKIYNETGENIALGGLKNITVGNDCADFYIKDNQIYAGVIRRTVKPEKMRVLISGTGYSGYEHESVSLTCDGDFILKTGDESKEYKKGDIIKLNKENGMELFSKNRIYIMPKEESSKVEILSIKRGSNINPKYRGIVEIEKRESGFVIINEVGLEEYLYAVVPSEMPTSYGLEASKVQAVTARSYAYNQFFGNRYHDYGANVDDSVLCQVYNNTGENNISIEAVNLTKGLCLTYGGNVISSNFFSTSGGTTANSGEVWANSGNKKFPTSTEEYTSSVKQYTKGDYGDFTIEENANKFFKDVNVESYDKSSGWFRWYVKMSGAEIDAVVNANIKKAYERSPYLVKTLQPSGVYRSRPIEKIGKVQDISVTKRGEGGNAMEVVIKGSEATVLVMTEYNIRLVLAPVQKLEGGNPINIICHNGTIMTNYSMMPSAFFTVEKDVNEDGIVSITFYGGGNGHGVGMSQNGVKGMIDAGFPFESILKHYYKGASIEKKL